MCSCFLTKLSISQSVVWPQTFTISDLDLMSVKLTRAELNVSAMKLFEMEHPSNTLWKKNTRVSWVFRANVCRRVIYEQESYRVSVRYTAIESYTTCCSSFIWCWDECQRTRWEVIYQRCYYIRISESSYKPTWKGDWQNSFES